MAQWICNCELMGHCVYKILDTAFPSVHTAAHGSFVYLQKLVGSFLFTKLLVELEKYPADSLGVLVNTL